MADLSWGVRVSRETKELAQQLIADSGLSAREFFEQLLSVWIDKNESLSSSYQSEELNELDKLLAQITSIFTGFLLRESSQTEKYKMELDILQKEVKDADARNEIIMAQKEEVGEVVLKLEDRIAVLNEMLVRYQGYEVTNHKLEKSVTELNNALKNSIDECERLKAKMAGMRDSHKNEIEQLKKQSERALELLTEKKDLQKEKETLRIRLDYQKKLEEVNKEYTAIIQSLQDVT